MVIGRCYHPLGNTPEWQSAVDLFVTNAANLMKAVRDTLKTSELVSKIPNNYTSDNAQLQATYCQVSILSEAFSANCSLMVFYILGCN